MSNIRRGLFDPRQRMQHWPEPNDDPNIPYAWGEEGLGYAINGYKPNLIGNTTVTSPKTVVTPVELNTQVNDPINETVVSVAIASSMVLGVWGLLDGYSQSENSGGERVFDSLEKAVIYATGIGFIACKVRKG